MPLRRAAEADRDWLVALVREPAVARSLAVTTEPSLTGALDRVLAGGNDEDVLVVQDDDGIAVGVVRWQTTNRRSRIAAVFGLVIAPEPPAEVTPAGSTELMRLRRSSRSHTIRRCRAGARHRRCAYTWTLAATGSSTGSTSCSGQESRGSPPV